MPLGVQAVGAPRGDADLLAHAAWMERRLRGEA
jgi:Asp-tRNA(Asn)/Glu-tRNA(Gln) amidotransferase A subunit family amidase